MEVVKLKKDNMAKNKKPNKPTNQDFVKVINQLIQDTQFLYDSIQALNQTFDLYIRFKGETTKFEEYVKTTLEELKQKEDNELQSAGQGDKVANTADSTN
jgi:hypothetical protein